MHMDADRMDGERLSRIARRIVALSPVNSRGEFDKYYTFYLNSKGVIDAVRKIGENLKGLDVRNYSARMPAIESCINELSQMKVEELGTEGAVEDFRKLVNELKKTHADALRDNLSKVRGKTSSVRSASRDDALDELDSLVDDDDDIQDDPDEDVDSTDEEEDDADDANEQDEEDDEEEIDDVDAKFKSIVDELSDYSGSYLKSCVDAFKSRYVDNANAIRSLLDSVMDIGHSILGPNADV